MHTPVAPLPVQVLDALQRGNTVEAIKLLRESTGLGLKEAKDIIDRHLRGDPVSVAAAASADPLPLPVVEALQRGNRIEAIKLLRESTGMDLRDAHDAVEKFRRSTAADATGLAPGEVPKSGRGFWWIAALALTGAVVYYLLRRAG